MQNFLLRDGCIFKTPTITNYTSNTVINCQENEILKGGIQQALIYVLEQVKDYISDRELNSDGQESLRRGLQILASANF